MNINTRPTTEREAIDQVDDANTLLGGGDVKYVYCTVTSWSVGIIPSSYSADYNLLNETEKAEAIAAGNVAYVASLNNNTDFEDEFANLYP